MPKRHATDLQTFMERLTRRTPHESEFHQAVREVLPDVMPVIAKDKGMRNAALLERLTEPDRAIGFRVSWERDDGSVQVNRGYRVQFSSAIGPYKGGLRFHPSVNPSILKFLGFEQTFKNALTGLPMGGAKGGADFDPKGCSDGEIRRFCEAYMLQLFRHIGPDSDIPAGDINVGAREIGYLFGTYRRISGRFESALTGKGLSFGGSEMRTEATGHGLVLFLCHMFAHRQASLEGKRVVISGAGNVATHAAQKAIELGATVLTLSDSRGFIHDKSGLSAEKLDWVRRHKATPGACLDAYAKKFKAKWYKGKKPWSVPCDAALPCATQNELDDNDARGLVESGCTAVAEGANMPCTPGAVQIFKRAGVLFGPAKAANAGGVAVSGLEISQNRMRRPRGRSDLQADLHEIMQQIHDRCAEAGQSGKGHTDYARGANIAAFRKLAEAITGQGIF